MTTFYLTGQTSFGNRGCEAIVRSSVRMLRDHFTDCRVLVPSTNPALDRAQWPEGEEHGVAFVTALKSVHNKYWRHVQRLPIPAIKRMGWPFPLAEETKAQIRGADAVLSIGGDNYSLDYLIPSLLMAQDGYAMDRGVPVVLWAASVGPFDREPHFVPYVASHLQRMAYIGARESVTGAYLRESLGLTNVEPVKDPAFLLEPEPVDISPFWPTTDARPGKVLGLNVSPLIERYRPKSEPEGELLRHVARFVDRLPSDVGVVLIPHVVPLDGSTKNNDAIYMERIFPELEDARRVRMMPRTFNAAQTKFVIGQCDFFIGARTHSTIAAISSGVPTGSIAYSVKAKGINHDIFGHDDFVLETPDVAQDTLEALFSRIAAKGGEIRRTLARTIPDVRDEAQRSARVLQRSLAQVQSSESD